MNALLPAAAGALVCAACGERLPLRSPDVQCHCGGLLEVDQPVEGRGQEWRKLFERRFAEERPGLGSGVWRFRELILPGRGLTVSAPEGNTRLYERQRISEFAGVGHLLLKHEGENPTGSFKDRGMTVAVTHGARTGATAVACASTGNTSASMAAYASLAGLPAFVFVPAGKVAAGKLAQSLAYGARTLLAKTDFDGCLRLAREASDKLGIRLLNSINPWRLEGQKTIVFELLQQLGWRSPDWLAVPAGNLGNTAAFGKALREALRLGLIRKAPRLLAVQAAGANPFYRSFNTGFKKVFAVQAETIATAIRIGDPASHERAVRSIRETAGVVAQVTDAEILEAKAVVDAAGVGCEPASAASVAGVRQLRKKGVIAADASVVAILTGHLLKDPHTVMEYHASGARRANAPVEIEPTLSEVERLLRR